MTSTKKKYNLDKPFFYMDFEKSPFSLNELIVQPEDEEIKIWILSKTNIGDNRLT